MQVHLHKAKIQEKRQTQNREKEENIVKCVNIYTSVYFGKKKIKANKQNICKETFQAIVIFQKQHDWQTVTCSDHEFS